MNRKAVSGIMLTLLLMGMLMLAFDIQTVKSEPEIWTVNDDEPAAFRKIQEALKKFVSIPEWSRHVTDSFSLHPADDEWTLEEATEWYDFFADNDSVELVIGINESQLDSYAQLMNLTAEYGGQLVKTVSIENRVKAALIDMPFGQSSSFAADIESAALSRYIEPNFEFHTCIVPNDYYWSRQWGPVKIEADEGWNWQTGDPSVLVAVIDTGVDYNHPDLATNYVPLGYDWVQNDTDPIDDNGHGTHCAGIIAGELNNGIGIAGMAQVRIMAEKGLNSGGSGSVVDLANAIVHAVDQGAGILSNSWGASSSSELIHEAVKYAYDHGVLVVAAAGNEASDMKIYPAAYDEVIAVTATDEFDNPAWFTNYGDWVEVAAPGVSIYSTISQRHDSRFNYPYDYLRGTSMSAPCVVGVAALIWSQFPDMTRDEVRLRLQSTTDDLGEPGFDIYYGYGRINARKAVEKALPSHDLLIWSFEAPLVLEPGKMVLINTTVLNFGENDEENVLVQLLVNGDFVDSKLIDFLVSGALATVNFSWSPIVESTYNITSYVKPVPGETITRNNGLSALVLVKTPKVIKVPKDYLWIQDAVNFADVGDIVQLAAGTHYFFSAYGVDVTKSLSIIGESSSNTTITPAMTRADTVIHITADNVLISGVTVENAIRGIVLYHCVGNTLRDISAVHIDRSLVVYGYTVPEFIHFIDTSNTVEGKPIYYLVNQQGLMINSSSFPSVRYLAIVNSTNINVKNLNLTLEGPFLAYTTYSTIENVSISDASVSALTLYRSSNNKIVGNFLSSSGRGIDLTHSGNNVIYGNSIVNCSWGIYFGEGCTANTIRENIVVGSETTRGIALSWSSDNALYNNTIFNGEYGIQLFGSGNNLLSGNSINTSYSLVVDGDALSHFIQDIDTSNLVYGKPIYYLVNQRNLIVEPSTFPSVGYLGLVNSTKVVVRDLQLTALSDYSRILFAFTSNSTIKNVTASGGQFGILLIRSNNNRIIDNTLYDNVDGVHLRESDYNEVCDNTLLSNENANIRVDASHHNNVSNNILQGPANGIHSVFSSSHNIYFGNRIRDAHMVGVGGAYASYDIISKNDICGCPNGIMLLFCSCSIISENDLNGNIFGISVFCSDNNLIRCNTISANERSLAVFVSNDNTIYHNNFKNNKKQAPLCLGSVTSWDNGYPSGGNYWSDYNGTDLYSGPYQNETGSDGIGDTPYVIDENNQDRYPLMNPGPYYQLTVTSSPITGVTFTINGVPQLTPYTEWLLEGSYTLVMPGTHNGYVWSHWLEDGDTNRTKTITLPGTTWTGVYVPAPLDVYTQKEPYSGKGLNQPSDAFAPQEEVQLYAYVSYYDDPVANKLVAFQVNDPTGEVWLYRTNSTDETGVATISFRIPTTPIFGEWTVYTTVDIAETTFNDTLTFKVGWIIEILKVETVDTYGASKTSFTKGEHLHFNVTVRNIAFTSKEATLTIVIYDECGVPIGHVILQDWLIPPGTTQIFVIDLQIPKWAYVGVATIYANSYSDLPTQQGTPTCPEKFTTFLITKT